MVADLEQIDARQAATDESSLDRCLGVPGQESRESTVAHHQDHRSVVDVAFGERRSRIGLGRIEDLDRGRRVEKEALARTPDNDRHRLICSIGHEPVVGWVLETDCGMHHGADVEPVEYINQSRHVILVRVAQHQHCDAAFKEWPVGPQAPKGQLRIWSAVDEHGRARWRFDQDRISLADVERRHMEASVRTRRDRDREQDAHQDEADRQGTQDSLGEPGGSAGGSFIG